MSVTIEALAVCLADPFKGTLRGTHGRGPLNLEISA